VSRTGKTDLSDKSLSLEERTRLMSVISEVVSDMASIHARSLKVAESSLTLALDLTRRG
jgi:hypothetical protein